MPGFAEGGRCRDFAGGASAGACWREKKLKSMPPSAVTTMTAITIMMRSPPGSYWGRWGGGESMPGF